MDVDVILLTDSTDVVTTQRTIYTLHESNPSYNFRVQLVDSGTNDPTRYKAYQNYIHPNIGFNYNMFINMAIKFCQTDWVIISNDDVGYERGWFDEIMKVHNERPDIESFSPKDPLLYLKYFNWHFINSPDQYFENYTVHEAIMGWCIVIKRCALNKIMPFDEQFDMYYQDNDYAEMLKLHGIKHALVKNSIACHLQTLNVEKASDAKKRKMMLDELKFRKKWK